MSLRFRAALTAERLRHRLLGVPLACPHDVDNDSRESPHDVLRFTVDGRPALLCYGRPSVRGRRIFGELVPYGQLWRTGANEPTTLHLPFAADVAGLPLPRGRYALYSVPGETDWVLVVNGSTRQSGRTREERGRRGRLFPNAYTEAVARAEVGRRAVESTRVDHVEQLSIEAEPGAAGSTTLLLSWEEVQLRIPIRALR